MGLPSKLAATGGPVSDHEKVNGSGKLLERSVFGMRSTFRTFLSKSGSLFVQTIVNKGFLYIGCGNTTDGEPPKNSLAFNRKCYTLALSEASTFRLRSVREALCNL